MLASSTIQYSPIVFVRAKIASGAEQERQDEARAYYAAQRAAGTLPVPEKSKK